MITAWVTFFVPIYYLVRRFQVARQARRSAGLARRRRARQNRTPLGMVPVKGD
jgi:hypothetical protein